MDGDVAAVFQVDGVGFPDIEEGVAVGAHGLLDLFGAEAGETLFQRVDEPLRAGGTAGKDSGGAEEIGRASCRERV